MTTIPTHVNMNADYVYLASSFAHADKYMEALSGVYVMPHPEGVLVVGCNGHDLAMFLDKSATTDAPFLLKLSKPFLTACKPAKKADKRLIIHTDGRTEVYSNGAPAWLSPECMFSDHQYPDVMRFFEINFSHIEEAEPFGNVAFSPNSLKLFISIPGVDSLRFFGAGKDNTPIYIKSLELPEFLGVTMPNIIQNGTDGRDEFFSNAFGILSGAAKVAA